MANFAGVREPRLSRLKGAACRYSCEPGIFVAVTPDKDRFRMKAIVMSVLLFLAVAIATQRVLAAPQVFASVCEDPAGGQTFYVQEKIDHGRHSSLEVAKVDMLPGEGISRLLVFSAVPGGIDEGDTYVSSDLLLIFSSDSDQYNLIAKANISLATEGETGPLIEGFRLHHDDGRVLQIIDEAHTLECRMR